MRCDWIASISWCNFSGWEVASCGWPKKVISWDRIFHCWRAYKIEITTKEWEYCCSVANFGTTWTAAHWTAACQASLSIINTWSPPKPTSIESLMPSNHLILCHPLDLLPSIFPSIRVFSNESALHIRWPKYCDFQIFFYINFKAKP